MCVCETSFELSAIVYVDYTISKMAPRHLICIFISKLRSERDEIGFIFVNNNDILPGRRNIEAGLIV